MAHATYTVTQNGKSNGNDIDQPFTIEVVGINFREDKLVIDTRTKNGAGDVCDNDDIVSRITYSLPAMTSSKNTDLVNTLEVDLTTAYGANWSKN